MWHTASSGLFGVILYVAGKVSDVVYTSLCARSDQYTTCVCQSADLGCTGSMAVGVGVVRRCTGGEELEKAETLRAFAKSWKRPSTMRSNNLISDNQY